jgi:cell fate (sporulation/competence/biofilm development) regulator YlbF (YheA/YmcA/DUF963 family)
MPWINWPSDRKISVAHRIRAFMQDEDVRAVFDELEKKYVDELIAGDNSEARSKAHARVHAFRSIVTELTTLMQSGETDEVIQELKRQRLDLAKQHGLLQ